jgi:hypothetical protein
MSGMKKKGFFSRQSFLSLTYPAFALLSDTIRFSRTIHLASLYPIFSRGGA